MDSIQVMMCLSLFVLPHLIIAQPESTNLIRRGSSLQPNTNRSLWLSHSGLFAFGFYKQGNGYAVGIWLVSTNPDNMTVVWTANRDDPPVSSNSTIQFTQGGQLVLRTSQGQDTRNITAIHGDQGVSALMLDSGNFVIYNNISKVIWQSFDSQTDTILGGQSMTYYTKLISSPSISNRSGGRFCLNIFRKRGLVAYPVNHTETDVPEEIYWEIKTTNVDPDDVEKVSLNLTGAGVLQLTKRELILQVVANVSYSSVLNETVIYRATLDVDGILRLYLHRFKMDGSSDVTIKWSALQNQCQVKGFCGFNSFCASNNSGVDCHCFPGFDYIDPRMKFMGCSRSFYDEEGCKRKQPALFYNLTGFENTKLGGLPYFLLSVSKEHCSKSCLEDCYCGAAYYVNGTCSKLKLPLMFGTKGENESGTVFIKWSSGNTKQTFPGHQQKQEHKTVVAESNNKRLIRILTASLGSITFLCLLITIYSFLVYKLRVDKYRKLPGNSSLGLTQEFTLQSFSYNELEQATDGFKQELGRGSYGGVYKGSISKGKKIVAVKRLENLEEEEQRKFRTEMAIVRQTHHRNLVRLLGICVEGSRKLLVYEYMSRGSLADLLFNVERCLLWKDRVRIALDVAKAIFYLHEECEVQIIHCNIKPKSILVDDSGTAKIFNFSYANLLMPNQIETISGMKGTRGYMAPEWKNNAFITTKSDVYSFGIVLLEIVCCRSNIEVNVETAEEVLLSTWVYKCFATGELNKLVQEEEVDMKSLERMVKVGLLCVQDDQTLRPSMKSVILMLDGTMNVTLPPPPTTASPVDT